MPICPKCRSEYEAHIKRCHDCNVDLVQSEADIIIWYNLVTTPIVMKEYIEIMEDINITEYKYEFNQEREGFVLQVTEENVERAMEAIKEWHKESTESEMVLLETEDVSSEDEKIQLKNTVSSYWSLAGVLIALAIVDFSGILPVVVVTRYALGIVSLLGAVICGYVAIKEKKVMTHAVAKAEEKEAIFLQNLEKVSKLLNKKAIIDEIKAESVGMDEGAKYYVSHDILKKHIDLLTLDFEESYINTLIDRLMDDYK